MGSEPQERVQQRPAEHTVDVCVCVSVHFVVEVMTQERVSERKPVSYRGRADAGGQGPSSVQPRTCELRVFVRWFLFFRCDC